MVVPIGCLMGVTPIMAFSGLALARLLRKGVQPSTKSVPKRKRWSTEDKRRPG